MKFGRCWPGLNGGVAALEWKLVFWMDGGWRKLVCGSASQLLALLKRDTKEFGLEH